MINFVQEYKKILINENTFQLHINKLYLIRFLLNIVTIFKSPMICLWTYKVTNTKLGDNDVQREAHFLQSDTFWLTCQFLANSYFREKQAKALDNAVTDRFSLSQDKNKCIVKWYKARNAS